MVATSGPGNPRWTRDETILALDLYFECREKLPTAADARVQALSKLLRSSPIHSGKRRNKSFRNPYSVAFKLQNLRQLECGKGLKNTSKLDREVWGELGENRVKTRELADLILMGINELADSSIQLEDDETFSEGSVVTATHLRRERNPRLRILLLDNRQKAGRLNCEICGKSGSGAPDGLFDAIFEVHHIIPLAEAFPQKTRLADLALLCANCHRLLHRLIANEKSWISIEKAREMIDSSSQFG